MPSMLFDNDCSFVEKPSRRITGHDPVNRLTIRFNLATDFCLPLHTFPLNFSLKASGRWKLLLSCSHIDPNPLKMRSCLSTSLCWAITLLTKAFTVATQAPDIRLKMACLLIKVPVREDIVTDHCQ